MLRHVEEEEPLHGDSISPNIGNECLDEMVCDGYKLMVMVMVIRDVEMLLLSCCVISSTAHCSQVECQR